jgi:hypothetical protein
MDWNALKAPFPIKDIEWLPGDPFKQGNQWKVKVMAYINARAVMSRLDSVIGPGNWYDEYSPAPNEDGNKCVQCTLYIKVGSEWVGKSDVGTNSKDHTAAQNNAEKGGYSDALKRAAVKWGIGRYLYDLGVQWVNCVIKEVKGKKYVKDHDRPSLPAWAMPPTATPQQPQPAGGRKLDTPTPSTERTLTNPQGDGIVPMTVSEFWAATVHMGLNDKHVKNRIANLFDLPKGSVNAIPADLPDGVSIRDAFNAVVEREAEKQETTDHPKVRRLPRSKGEITVMTYRYNGKIAYAIFGGQTVNVRDALLIELENHLESGERDRVQNYDRSKDSKLLIMKLKHPVTVGYDGNEAISVKKASE